MENSETKKMILAIDDVGESLVTIRAILRNRYDVKLAKSGDVGFQVLEKFTPDVILLDIEMPDMDGFTFLEKLQANSETKSIPVVFVTSSATREFIIKASSAGAQGYIVKPIEPALLLQKLEEILGPNKS